MNIILRDPADDSMLDLAIAEYPDKKQVDRLRAVRYALGGCETQEIVEMLGRSRSFVQDWCYAYRDGGLEAIKVKKQTGRPPKLKPEQQDAFKQRILDGPPTPTEGFATSAASTPSGSWPKSSTPTSAASRGCTSCCTV